MHPVWVAETNVDSLGWTAEMRIPWSQLRFSGATEQTWGMQIWRKAQRLNENRTRAASPRGHMAARAFFCSTWNV